MKLEQFCQVDGFKKLQAVVGTQGVLLILVNKVNAGKDTEFCDNFLKKIISLKNHVCLWHKCKERIKDNLQY